MIAATLASVGLCLNMLGVGFAFFFGYPQPSHSTGIGLGLEDATELPNGRTVAQHNEQVEKRRAQYLLMSRIGLALMLLGFILQLVAVWFAVGQPAQ